VIELSDQFDTFAATVAPWSSKVTDREPSLDPKPEPLMVTAAPGAA
jgi:hypothetical protein